MTNIFSYCKLYSGGAVMAASEYGKFLKKLRIDRDQQLQTMARNMGISASYLSAIESGNRDIPVDFTEKLIQEYGLSEDDRGTLHKLELATERKSIQLDVNKDTCSEEQKEIALLFAQKFAKLDSSRIAQIREILERI